MLKLMICTITLLLGAHAQGQTQVYKSEDSAGNPVFSDQPSSGASQVEVPDANIVDAVEAPAAAPAEEAQPEEPAAAAEPAWQAPDPDASRDDVIIIGDQTVPRRAKDTGDNPRHEVSDAKAPAGQSSARPRHEVGD